MIKELFDKVASNLEARGFIKEAEQLDVLANTYDKLSFEAIQTKPSPRVKDPELSKSQRRFEESIKSQDPAVTPSGAPATSQQQLQDVTQSRKQAPAGTPPAQTAPGTAPEAAPEAQPTQPAQGAPPTKTPAQAAPGATQMDPRKKQVLDNQLYNTSMAYLRDLGVRSKTWNALHPDLRVNFLKKVINPQNPLSQALSSVKNYAEMVEGEISDALRGGYAPIAQDIITSFKNRMRGSKSDVHLNTIKQLMNKLQLNKPTEKQRRKDLIQKGTTTKKLATALDEMAASFEKKGMVKEAEDIDIISNTIEDQFLDVFLNS